MFYVSTDYGFGIAPKHVATSFKIAFSSYWFPNYVILLPLAKDWGLSDTEGTQLCQYSKVNNIIQLNMCKNKTVKGFQAVILQ